MDEKNALKVKSLKKICVVSVKFMATLLHATGTEIIQSPHVLGVLSKTVIQKVPKNVKYI